MIVKNKKEREIMYISYDKLWKLLIDKDLKKTDLLSLCGISSRTLAKLSKNENVNSDTLLRICEVLQCDLFDIMELCKEEEQASFYETFRAKKELVSKDETKRIYTFSFRGKQVVLFKTVKKANKYSIIHCNTSTVTWEQVNQITIHTAVSEYFELSFAPDTLESDTLYVLVISGTPNHIKKLDEGMFVSAIGTPRAKKSVFVMSEARLKLFDPPRA